MTHGGDLSTDEVVELERAIGVGSPQDIGSFRFCFATKRWEWSAEVARLHGYEPDAVEPTTELLLSHKHPEDRDRLEAMITSVEDGGPFSSRHRIIDAGGRVHEVMVVSDRMIDDNGDVIGTWGYYIDLTDTLAECRREALDDTLPQLVEAREVIEQAKGALMLAYGINADQAFRVLKWRSQDTNTKLRTLAARVIAELPAVARDEIGLRTRLDHLLLTAHQRNEPVA
ncbi:PAS and ANTAR domain-containing protein [Nocardia sp. NPDC023852]|uniref:PAS and ANTAR domain-containing protein n=1 Tax=Nocardia sp. NPDC023852 TaxID=3154697 RepID=UPI003409417F